MTDIVQEVMLDLVEHFSFLDDREDAPFGNYARVELDGPFIKVMHETEEWGILVHVSSFKRDERPIIQLERNGLDGTA